ncbi:MAG: acyltransferase domain-containing protein [Sandaracinaceae bacterium]|nr:acyltransferase domain-containing protein [Sandaracinaceae bacterium]
MNDPFMFECFAKTTALSKQGDCRPFDASADGTMLGEGVGMVVLERLDDALRAKHPVYAVIRGVGSSSDGRAKSVYAPLPSGQAKALRRAYERAGYGPETVELVEAHGTGTAAGDAAELEALATVFGERREGARFCAIGSVKSQIGHTKAAAGSAGLIKAVLALRHGVLPPTIKIEQPAEALAKGGPFYANTRARPWIRGGDHPRRASVSSFGFGGSNFHVALEEHTGEGLAPRVPVGGAELVLLHANSASALAAAARSIAKDARTPGMLRWLAYDSQRAFDASAPARLSLVAESEEELAGQLEMALPFLDRGEAFRAPGGLEIALGEASREPLALLFPGQGSQYLEMGAALAARFSCARAVWDRAAEADFGGVHEVVFPPPSFDEAEREAEVRRLTATEWAQPALGVAGAAALSVLRALGVRAAAYGGHSFGEVTALFAAGALSERDLVRVARERGERMAEAASNDGAMLAVSAAIDVVRAAVLEAGLEVTVANHNHPEQVVLSGATAAIERAEAALRERRVRASRLEVATAFHSPIVSASREPFARFLSSIELGELDAPVYANATAAPYEASRVRETLAAQIAEPVRFVEQIEAMHAAGVRTFVEVGPGSVLTGLVGRILKGRPTPRGGARRQGRLGPAAVPLRAREAGGVRRAARLRGALVRGASADRSADDRGAAHDHPALRREPRQAVPAARRADARRSPRSRGERSPPARGRGLGEGERGAHRWSRPHARERSPSRSREGLGEGRARRSPVEPASRPRALPLPLAGGGRGRDTESTVLTGTPPPRPSPASGEGAAPAAPSRVRQARATNERPRARPTCAARAPI